MPGDFKIQNQLLLRSVNFTHWNKQNIIWKECMQYEDDPNTDLHDMKLSRNLNPKYHNIL